MLNWRTVTKSNDPKFMVRGTELSCAIVPDTVSRFQVCDHRAYVWDDTEQRNVADRTYCVRDADTISDVQRRDKVRPLIVYRSDNLDDALAWCRAQA